MICAVITSIFGVLSTLILYFRYIFFLQINKEIKIVCIIPLLLIGCLPMLTDYKFEKYLGFLYPFYRYFLFFIFIMTIILLTLTIARDIFWEVGYLINKKLTNPINSIYLQKINLITIAMAFFVTCFALYNGIKVPRIKEVEIKSEKILTDKRIVLLSDLHLHRVLSVKKLQGIVEKTNKLNADAVLLLGDIIDDESSRIQKQLKVLKNLKGKVYVVAGNHENYVGYIESRKILENLGFTFLENDGDSVSEDLFVGGIPDIHSSKFSGKRYDLAKTFEKAGDKQYKILMSHTPADFKNKNFDLEVAGHTHGGQIFPFVFFIYLHAKYVAGFYDLGGAKLYITRGAGQWGPQMRFFAPSEITVIDLKGNNNLKEKKMTENIKNNKVVKETVIKEVKHSENSKVAKVYFTHDISPEGLLKLYEKVNGNIKGKVALKWHSGEPHGPNILPIPMVKAMVESIPNSTLVETNVYYESPRQTTEGHRETLKINGWTFSPVDIMDEDGTVMLPIKNGKHFKEMSMGSHIINYDSMVALTHFKGHTMGGFGGSIKNLAIGNADGKIGKKMIHTREGDDQWSVTGAEFMENMVESVVATKGHFGDHMAFLNVLRNMSVDCDCAGTSASPVKIRDVGILASTDIVALDQASLDMVYSMPETELHDLRERIESREGPHQLPYAEEMGLGTRNYELISLDDDISDYDRAIDMVKNDEVDCLLLKNNKIISSKKAKGLSPLLELLDNEPENFKDATLVDKVIGKSAAFIAMKAGVRTVYGELMSEEALKLLSDNHIPATYGKLVPKILNNKQDDICPMDKAIENINSVDKAVEIIRSKISEFKK